MISRINKNVKATDIVQEVDVLKAISWIKSAWGELSEETIVNCFKKCGFWKSQLDVQLTDFAQEEELESLVKELSTDVKKIAWQQESCQNAIDTVMGCHNDQQHMNYIESDD